MQVSFTDVSRVYISGINVSLTYSGVGKQVGNLYLPFKVINWKRALHLIYLKVKNYF